MFLDKPVPKVPNNIPRNPNLFLVTFSFVRVTPFIDKPESWRNLTVFSMFFISSLDIISVVVPEAKAADAKIF